ncbi:MAG: hypothetical protein IGS23_05430 [Rivularia sp. T60_A2020_040]|nr:hypothetical protein [Rivularia sp. T60_A2020_040]
MKKMISQLPMPIEFQKLAIEGYRNQGRGFVRLVTNIHGCDLGKYHSAEDYEAFNTEPNTEREQRDFVKTRAIAKRCCKQIAILILK